MVSPLKMPSISLPPLVSWKIFGSGQDGLWALEPRDGARAERDHAVGRLAAQHLLPGPGDDIEPVPGQRHGEGGRGGVADAEPFAVGRDPGAVGHAHARGRAVPGEDDVAVAARLLQVRQRAIVGLERAHVLEAKLLHHVARPRSCRRLSQAKSRRRAGRAATRAPSPPRRCRRRARCRACSRPASSAPGGCARSPRRAWRGLPSSGASGRARPCPAPPATSPAAWRRGRRKSRDCAGAALVSLHGKRSFTVASSTKSAASYGLCCGASTTMHANLANYSNYRRMSRPGHATVGDNCMSMAPTATNPAER